MPSSSRERKKKSIKNQKVQTGRAELSDFFYIFCNSKNIPVNSQNSEKEERFSCIRPCGFRYFDSAPSQKPRPILRKRTSLQRFWTGSVWTGDLYRGDRHNRFHFISPFICIDCGDPSLDSYLCVTMIWPYPLLHSELLVLLRISAGIPFT